MHNPATANSNQRIDLAQQRDPQGRYGEDYMNLDDNLFPLDSEGRDMIFGMPTSLGVILIASLQDGAV